MEMLYTRSLSVYFNAITFCLALICFPLQGARMKISMEGDVILEEGHQADYRVSIRNIGKKPLKNVRLHIEGFSSSGLNYCFAQSAVFRIGQKAVDDLISPTGFLPSLGVHAAAQMTITCEASMLPDGEDLKTIQLVVIVSTSEPGTNSIRKSITLFKTPRFN